MASERDKKSLEAGLRVLAGERGAAGKSGYAIVREGRRIRVEYGTDSDDDVTWLALVCRYDDVATPHVALGYRGEPALTAVRPLDIRLERERDGHVRAKREGLVVEWQSGDPEFDARVFVDSPTTEPRVLAAVLGPEVRKAVGSLLELGFDLIRIDADGEVRARLEARAFVRERDSDGLARAASAVDAFIGLSGRLPAIDATGGRHPARPLATMTSVLKVLGVVGWFGNVPFVWLSYAGMAKLQGVPITEDDRTAVMLGCVAVGIVGGLAGSRGYANLVASRARGRSDALGLRSSASLAGFGGFSVLTFLGALAVAVASGWF